MIFPDVNVLVYAFRPDAEHFSTCRSWLDGVIFREQMIAVTSQVLAGVVRITTNRRIYKPPSILREAIEYCDDLLSYPFCRVIDPGDRHWAIFTSLLKETNTTGPMVSDAWLAALAIEWNCEFVTMDRDFARFPGLRWSVPKISG